MKKFVAMAGLLMGLLSCTKPQLKSSDIVYVTSFYPMYIMALNVAGDIPGVTINNMAAPTAGCLHDYQLTPENLKSIEKASAFVINGGGAENFLSKVTALYPSMNIINSSYPFITNEQLVISADDHDHDDGHNHAEHTVNEHFWLSVPLAIEQVKTIADQMSSFDPAHAEQYQANAEAYMAKLEELFNEMKKELEPYAGHSIITFHEAFPYFARDFNLNVLATFEHEEGIEPSPAELAQLIDLIKANPNVVLFAELQYPSRLVELVAHETNKRMHVLDSAVSGDFSKDSYIKSMRYNMDVLKRAFM